MYIMLKLCFLLSMTLVLFSHLTDGICCTRNNIRFDVKEPLTCADFPAASKLWTQKGSLLLPNSQVCSIWVCKDGKPVTEGNYCGKGSCNPFGCKCDGGCREGKSSSTFENFKELHGNKVQNVRG